MLTSTIKTADKYRITIPKDIRNALSFNFHDQLKIFMTESNILFVKTNGDSQDCDGHTNIDAHGRITIPVSIARRLRLAINNYVQVSASSGTLVVSPPAQPYKLYKTIHVNTRNRITIPHDILEYLGSPRYVYLDLIPGSQPPLLIVYTHRLSTLPSIIDNIYAGYCVTIQSRGRIYIPPKLLAVTNIKPDSIVAIATPA